MKLAAKELGLVEARWGHAPPAEKWDDVQNKSFDRLLLTPVRRTAILLGHMAADVAVSAALTLPIIALGLILGVRFHGGVFGVLGAGVKMSVGTPFGIIDSGRFHATDAYFAAGSLTAIARWKNGNIVGAHSLRANVNVLLSFSAYA